jgi:hypothetical protein
VPLTTAQLDDPIRLSMRTDVVPGDPVELAAREHRVQGRTDPDTDEVAAAERPEGMPTPADGGAVERQPPSALRRLGRWLTPGD